MTDIKRKNDQSFVSYLMAAVVAAAVAIPLAVATNQVESGELFVECFADECDAPLFASLDD